MQMPARGGSTPSRQDCKLPGVRLQSLEISCQGTVRDRVEAKYNAASLHLVANKHTKIQRAKGPPCGHEIIEEIDKLNNKFPSVTLTRNLFMNFVWDFVLGIFRLESFA
jgi:hypothetical protein